MFIDAFKSREAPKRTKGLRGSFVNAGIALATLAAIDTAAIVEVYRQEVLDNVYVRTHFRANTLAQAFAAPFEPDRTNVSRSYAAGQVGDEILRIGEKFTNYVTGNEVDPSCLRIKPDRAVFKPSPVSFEHHNLHFATVRSISEGTPYESSFKFGKTLEGRRTFEASIRANLTSTSNPEIRSLLTSVQNAKTDEERDKALEQIIRNLAGIRQEKFKFEPGQVERPYVPGFSGEGVTGIDEKRQIVFKANKFGDVEMIMKKTEDPITVAINSVMDEFQWPLAWKFRKGG